MSSHRARRAFLKKLKRKQNRQLIAQARDKIEAEELARRQASPSFLESLRIQEETEQKLLLEQKKNERLWLEREEKAQHLWQEEQAKKLLIEQKQREIQQRIRDEWEQKQAEIKETKLKAIMIKPTPTAGTSTTVQPGPSDAELPPWHHPPPPTELSHSDSAPNLNQPAVKAPEQCSFFRKTGACRYGFMCSRRHDYPTPSDYQFEDREDGNDLDQSCLVLIFPNMFTHFQLNSDRTTAPEDQDADLELDDNQLQTDYNDFYYDVRSELESKWGRLAALRTCRNQAEHLRGSVYVEFGRGSSATWDAARHCLGRWFAGFQLNCIVVRLGGGWREAICGLYHRGKCPKGNSQCNFLHVFLNPTETVSDLHKALQLQLGELRPTLHSSNSPHSPSGSFQHSVNSRTRYRSPYSSSRSQSFHSRRSPRNSKHSSHSDRKRRANHVRRSRNSTRCRSRSHSNSYLSSPSPVTRHRFDSSPGSSSMNRYRSPSSGGRSPRQFNSYSASFRKFPSRRWSNSSSSPSPTRPKSSSVTHYNHPKEKSSRSRRTKSKKNHSKHRNSSSNQSSKKTVYSKGQSNSPCSESKIPANQFDPSP